MSFIVNGIMALMIITIMIIFIGFACRIIEIIWICLFMIFEPCMCPNRRRDIWIIEICNCILILCNYIQIKTIYCCALWSNNIGRRIENCKKAVSVEPINYDEEHIIVVNPYDYQIATVSKPVNV